MLLAARPALLDWPLFSMSSPAFLPAGEESGHLLLEGVVEGAHLFASAPPAKLSVHTELIRFFRAAPPELVSVRRRCEELPYHLEKVRTRCLSADY